MISNSGDVNNMRSRLLRYWTYFRRGHNVYLMFALNFLNFIVIQWNLLIMGFEPLFGFFQNVALFTVIFLSIYIPLSTVIGWTDYRRGAVPIDQTIVTKASPWHNDIAKAILLLAEGKNEEVVEVMKRWIS